MKKPVIFLVVAVVLITTTVIVVPKLKKKSATVTYKTAAVAKGTLVATASGTGNIVVSDSAKINPSISGTVSKVYVAVGDIVKKGQTLMTISNDDLDVAVQKATTGLTQAKQSLVNAQSALVTAKANYSAQTGSVGIAKAQAAVEQAKLTLVQAQQQYAQDQTALTANPADAVLQQKVALDAITITTNTDTVTTAQTSLTQLKSGTGAAVQAAKAQLSAAQSAVDVAQQGVTSAQSELATQKDNAAKRTVTAPIAGTITTLNVAAGDTLGSSSASASGSGTTSTTPIVIQDLTTLQAVVAINEVDIANVAVGQKASMSFDAVSGLTLTGKVEKVDTAGTATQGVVSYSATIGFDVLDAKVRPEMSVNAVITTEVKQDVLSIASTAVKSQSDGSSYVQVMENGAPRNQTVTTGVSSDTATEIISGLSEGQTVVTQTITATTNTSTTTTNRNNRTGGFQGIGGPGGFGG